MIVLRICLWVSYECPGGRIVPVGEVSYECVGVTIVPVGELRVCLCYECACR